MLFLALLCFVLSDVYLEIVNELKYKMFIPSNLYKRIIPFKNELILLLDQLVI